MIENKINAIAARTSIKKYLYQGNFIPYDFKWCAPLCFITYSVQYITSSFCVFGRSLNLLESAIAFALYLGNKYSVILKINGS